MGARDKKQDATRGTKDILVRVIGCIALFVVGACVQIAGITKPTLLDENAGGAGGEGGNGSSSSASATSSSGSAGATSSSSSASSSSGSLPCMNAGECPSDTPCVNWSCIMAVCAQTFTAQGTVVGDTIDNDCKVDACDGAGQVTTVIDDTDLPPFDGNQCTSEGCNNGTPMTTNDPVGTACGNGDHCNAVGMCVECVIDGDCTTGTSPSCVQEACISCSDGVKNGDEVGVDCGGAKCKKCNGGACAAGADCKSGFCADGICCDNACTGTCKSCNLAATVGTCTNIPFYMPDGSPTCNGMNACDGAGACKLKDGEVCTSDLACLSGTCLNGSPRTCAF